MDNKKLPVASAIKNGILSFNDWNIFNNKQNNLGYTPESISNKVTTMIGNIANNVVYLSAKTIYDRATGLFATITQLNTKQDILVSGTNIKTINNNNLLGSGNLQIGRDIIDNLAISEEISNSTVNFSNITGLGQTLTGGKIYEIEGVFVWNTTVTTNGIKLSFAGVAAPSIYSCRIDIPTGTTTSGVFHYAAPGTETATANASRINSNFAYMRIVFGCTTTGLYYPRFASEVGTGTTTIKRGSNIKIREII